MTLAVVSVVAGHIHKYGIIFFLFKLASVLDRLAKICLLLPRGSLLSFTMKCLKNSGNSHIIGLSYTTHLVYT